jgi:RHS repeat-associated protein
VGRVAKDDERHAGGAPIAQRRPSAGCASTCLAYARAHLHSKTRVWGSRAPEAHSKRRMHQRNRPFSCGLASEDIKASNNFHRWYRREDGRYLSPDPIGLGGGEPGYSAYVNSNPLVGSDRAGTIVNPNGKTVTPECYDLPNGESTCGDPDSHHSNQTTTTSEMDPDPPVRCFSVQVPVGTSPRCDRHNNEAQPLCIDQHMQYLVNICDGFDGPQTERLAEFCRQRFMVVPGSGRAVRSGRCARVEADIREECKHFLFFPISCYYTTSFRVTVECDICEGIR